MFFSLITSLFIIDGTVGALNTNITEGNAQAAHLKIRRPVFLQKRVYTDHKYLSEFKKAQTNVKKCLPQGIKTILVNFL